MRIGDVNGDGREDVFTPSSQNQGVNILLQQGDGTLATSHATVPLTGMTTGTGMKSAALRDLDGDGAMEILIGTSPLQILSLTSTAHTRQAVRSVAPVEYSTNAALGTASQVVFTADVDSSTVDDHTVRLVDGRTGATVVGSVSYDAGSRTATITPAAPLHRAKPYRIVVDGVQLASGMPVLPFASTFTTTNTGPLAALQDFAVRGQLGTAAAVSAVVPIGDLDFFIVRYDPGTTPPASPSAGSAGYTGVGGGIMIGGLTPGQTYSFSVWYRDRNGNQSPQSTATLVGTTLTMTGTSTSAGPGAAAVTFGGTVSTPGGPGAGMLVPLVGYCVDGPFGGEPVATATGNALGLLSVTLTLSAPPRCTYRWEITNSTQYLGAATTAVRVTAGPNLPPGETLPRER